MNTRDDHPIEIRDTRKRDFFMVNNVIIDHYASIIGPFATLTYTALCRHADHCTHESYPSHAFLAKELRISLATVKRAISMLISHRLLSRKRRTSRNGDPDTNIYIILEPWGGVSQNLPHTDETLREHNVNQEVGSVGTEVGSVGTEGRVSQTPGVGSVRATNNTQLEQDSLNKKKIKDPTPTPPKNRKGRVSGEKSTRLPEDWTPTEADDAWAKKKGYHTLVNLEDTTEEFCRYWWSLAKNNTKLNWSMTWQNRVQELAKRELDRRQKGGIPRTTVKTPGVYRDGDIMPDGTMFYDIVS